MKQSPNNVAIRPISRLQGAQVVEVDNILYVCVCDGHSR
jgi:hypothetical protein